jgi:uncharacterized protein YacL
MRIKNMAQNQTQSTSANKKISTYLTMIVLIVMALAITALFIAAYTYLTALTVEDQITSGVFAGIGLIALVLSVFLLFQSKRQTAQIKIEVPKVMTTIECTNKGCNTKTVREFQRGDYVYKDLDIPCPKCGGKQMITAIYKEIKEKEKTYNV